MPNIFPIRGRRSNEELFFDKYPLISKWASQLSHNDPDRAEDLMQDFYIQIAHLTVTLSEVNEVEPYLFKILRNLHYSQLRRRGKASNYERSIMEFDSLEWGLAAIDRNGLLLVRDSLKKICEFTCQRKKTSRAASIFILRFFLGYYSSEVMKIAHMTRMGVDRALQVARGEARLYLDTPGLGNPGLDRPGALRSEIPSEQYGARSSETATDTRALFLELQQIIFNSCDGACLSARALESHYASDPAARFFLAEFAHLVSCKRCLDRVNEILELPLIDERSPDDTIGRDNPPGSSGTSSGFSVTRGKKPSRGAKERKALERRMRDFREHRPDSLEIAIDGETRATQRVTAEISELTLKLNRTEEQGFIEVFSQQGVRLAYLHVTEPTRCPDLEQRQHVSLSDGRSLDVVLSHANDLSSVHVTYRDPVFAEAVDRTDEESEKILLTSWAEPAPVGADAPSLAIRKTPVPFRYLLSALDHRKSRMNPLFATAVVLGATSALCFALWMRSSPGISAHDLLLRSQKQEVSVAQSEPSGVIVQKVRIQTLARTTERTLCRDIQHKRRAKEQIFDANDSKLRARLTAAGVDWDDPLSPTAYRDWRNREFIQSDSVKQASGDLFILTTNVNDGEVVSESLKVRASDFHAVGKTVQLRDYGTVEIAELSYSVLPWSTVSSDWFEPLAAMPRGVSSVIHPSLLPRLARRLSDRELDQAELEARLALSQLHAEGERLEISRAQAGVRVQGVVETAARKREIEQELKMIPHVVPVVHTFEEVSRQPSAGSANTSIAELSTEAKPSPLEKYLLAKGESREEVSEIYRRFFRSSVVVSQSSRAIADLQQRFATGNRLTATAQTALERLIVQDKADLEAALRAQDSLLRLLGNEATNFGSTDALTYAGSLLASASEKNASLCNELIGGGGAQSRDAEAIFPELSSSIAQVWEVVNALPNHPKSRSALSRPTETPTQLR